MNNKYLLSAAASSLIIATFSFTGCGGGSSGGESNTSSSLSSSSTLPSGSTIVRVSDGYVLGAVVKVGTREFEIEIGNGEYEISEDGVLGALTSVGGVNDTNSNGIPDQGEPVAPNMSAPSGYNNITPFTTALVNGVDIASEADYQSIAQFAPNYDFDVVNEGSNFSNGIAQAAAIAALRLAAGGDGSSTQESSTSSIDDGSLPGTGGSVLSSSSSIISSSSSSVISSGTGGSILPSANQLRGVLPGGDTGSSVVSSSSSSVYVSSSSSSLSSTSSYNSSMSNSDLQTAIDAVRNANSSDDLINIINQYMPIFTSSYVASSTSSEVSSLMQESSSISAIGGVDDCLPGFDCSVTSSSSLQFSSSLPSSSSLSYSSENSLEQQCLDNGGRWTIEGVCIVTTQSSSSIASSSSVATSTGGTGSVLPQ